MENSSLSGPRRTAQVVLCVVGITLLLGPVSVRGQAHGPLSSVSVQPSVPQSVDSLTAPGVAFSLRYALLQARTASSDPWLGPDKAKHAVGSALWTLSTQYVIVNKAGWTERDGVPVSIASGVAIGVTKELYDASRSNGQASVRDLVADAVGVGVAVGIIAL